MSDEESGSNLIDRTFRANPGYHLTPFDRLPAEQQQTLAGLKDDPDFYGLLVASRGGGLRSKSVSQQTALLFLTLQQPGSLPFYVIEHSASDLHESVAQLISESVLEVQVGDAFVSGALAHGLLFPTPDGGELSFLGSLSWEAIRYGASLEGLGTLELSGRLYYYNRVPASAFWRSRFPSPEVLARHWGIDRGLEYLPGGEQWRRSDPGSSEQDWLSWRRPRPEAASEHQATYKLYVSPDPDHVGNALAETLRVLSAVGAPAFKIGGNLLGLLRPDKIVCYLEDFDQLSEAAGRLAVNLAGTPRQGVPFTCELAGEGLLSWGVDPASSEQAFGWLGRQSWRLWITNHLAASLVSAGAGNAESVPGWRFALDRLSLEGVDIQTWAPTDLGRLASASDSNRGVGAWR